MKIPILVLAFNRADHVIESLKSIKEYQPDRLYLACDGPRQNKPGERAAVDETRKAMITSVDWNCEIKTLFRETNLGCARAVYEAISWFFENEEYGIICEDDIIIHADFFMLCEKYLPKYQNEQQVMMICAYNPVPNYDKPNELCFMNVNHIWGWGSWRRAWEKMDMSLSQWPSISKIKLFKEWGVFRGLFQYFRWNSVYKNIETCNSWATRWNFAIFANEGLNLFANVNLMKNIGLTEGTHYTKYDVHSSIYLKFGEIDWPVIPPPNITMTTRSYFMLELDCIKSKCFALLKRIRKYTSYGK